jgi:hypothetical protein
MGTQPVIVGLYVRAAVLGVVAFVVGLMVLVTLQAAPALAVTSSPQWTVTSVSRPTDFAPPGSPGYRSGEDAYMVTVTNTGGSEANGKISPITITDELPGGLLLDPAGASGEDELASVKGTSGAKLSCVLRSCTYDGVVPPDDTLVLTFPVGVAAIFNPVETNVVRVSGGGGGASGAAVETPTTISSEHAKFGIALGGASTALSSLQAGAYPDITTSIAFNTVNRAGALAADPKDTIDDLPAGFALDLPDAPVCPPTTFLHKECPINTQVGVTTVTLTGGEGGTFLKPVYNLSPDPGSVAKIGFILLTGLFIEGDISLLPGSYEGQATFYNIDNVLSQLSQVSLTLWGVPADPVHNPLRWLLEPTTSSGGQFGASSETAPAPFFINPTVCGSGSLEAKFSVSSWEEPEQYVSAGMPFGPVVGCDRLNMEPSITAEPTTSHADAPTGLDLGMSIPQTYNNPEGLATSTLKREVVTLPEGMTVNPSAGAGLGACTEEQLAKEAAQFVAGEGCPNESKLGEVSIVSPDIKEPIDGSVFLAQPYANKFGSLLALYVVARLPDRGIIIKAEGEVTANPLTGQLVTTFDDLPPLPFSALTFKFHSGATAPLVTPPVCGSYEVKAQMTPWSNPDGAPLTPLIPPFPITSGVEGGSCPSGGVPPFSPQVSAGTLNNRAGSYSPLDLRITRNDGEQEITRFSSQLPPGLTANLSGLPFCSDTDIELAKQKTGAQEEADPACPVASEIGHTLVGVGVGSVLSYTPGKVYMAGPYNGAPFSIVAITSAKVGPFDLGTVVVREALEINPETAIVTVDAKASDPIPHIIDGIVVHVRDIQVYIDRPNFSLNPTNCEHLTFAATIGGGGANPANPSDETSTTVDDPFQAADCQSLKFKPLFTASTVGKTSRRNGASLTFKLAYPKAPQGSQANIRSVKVDLPKQLPSRLTTLQKACPARTFETNPAGCSAASRVGHATAITPILPVPLTGPAYFVSHGGAKFPELIIVLQGYGVTIDLHSETFISKKGITSGTIHTVPDQPVTSFELTLPQGPYSALAANGNLCTSKLAIPTAFTAQNGLTIHQSTPVSVTGCAKHKKKTSKKTTRTKTHQKGTHNKKK